MNIDWFGDLVVVVLLKLIELKISVIVVRSFLRCFITLLIVRSPQVLNQIYKKKFCEWEYLRLFVIDLTIQHTRSRIGRGVPSSRCVV